MQNAAKRFIKGGPYKGKGFTGIGGRISNGKTGASERFVGGAMGINNGKPYIKANINGNKLFRFGKQPDLKE